MGSCKECIDCELMLSELHLKYSNIRELFQGLSNCTPDFVWAKGLDGRYKYANITTASRLYQTDAFNMLGKTDIELANETKDIIGHNNFTFGSVCSNSDKDVILSQGPRYFLEKGLVNGEELVLMVHKNVERDIHGAIIGTVGIGRDVTDEYNELISIAESTEDPTTRNKLYKLISKHYYENEEDK